MLSRISLKNTNNGLGDIIEYSLRYITPIGESVYKNFTNFDALLADIYGTLGFNYDESVTIVHDRLNWNRCKNYGGSDYDCAYNKNFKQWDVEGFLPFEKAKNVVNTYTNLALRTQNPLPEYNPNDKTNAPLIIKAVANAAATSEKEAKEVLDNGFYSFKSGELPDDFIVFPQRYQKNKDLRITNEIAPSGGNTVEDIGEGLFSYGKYVLIAGAVVAGLYGLTLLKAK